MSLYEARAYLAQANLQRPLGRTGDELARMQRGRMVFLTRRNLTE